MGYAMDESDTTDGHYLIANKINNKPVADSNTALKLFFHCLKDWLVGEKG